MHTVDCNTGFHKLISHEFFEILGFLLEVGLHAGFGLGEGFFGCHVDLVINQVFSKCKVDDVHPMGLDALGKVGLTLGEGPCLRLWVLFVIENLIKF